ncbi:tyrosine decarboxylase 1-like [Camellia sinensis]|uniref:tyrosine decarboxylase 1-like n=1 Tax=Camellia sinensis TaxID=4442 RepID=UPI0010358852|nr:tyrosine decarboxylase 1-like [Camellia sinensis]
MEWLGFPIKNRDTSLNPDWSSPVELLQSYTKPEASIWARYLSKLLPDSAPNQPESLQDVLSGEMLSAGINMVGFSWITSSAATELEMIVLDWLAKLLKLPDDFLSTGC